MHSSKRIKSKTKGINKINEEITRRSLCKIKRVETNWRGKIKINDISPELWKRKITNHERVLINEIWDVKIISGE